MINENKKGVKAVKHTTKSKGVEPPKPRNFVAKNAINTGAGAHKDKKKAAKQGDVKHKKQEYAESLQDKLTAALGESNRSVAEAGNPQQAAIAIAKKKSGKYTKDGKRKTNEGWTTDTLAAQLFELPSYENRLQEMLDGQVAFMEGGTDDGVTMFSKEPGSRQHQNEAGYDKEEYNDEAGMVKNNLHTIIRVSTHLGRDIGNDENIPEWVQEKIAQAKGMIVSVMDYMISQHEMGVKPKQK
jgi:hypothetical protein